MCTNVMVCHGDRVKALPSVYNAEQAQKLGGNDCKPATFYVTNDGKYAIDADFVSVADLNDPNFNLDDLPKIEIAALRPTR